MVVDVVGGLCSIRLVLLSLSPLSLAFSFSFAGEAKASDRAEALTRLASLAGFGLAIPEREKDGGNRFARTLAFECGVSLGLFDRADPKSGRAIDGGRGGRTAREPSPLLLVEVLAVVVVEKSE